MNKKHTLLEWQAQMTQAQRDREKLVKYMALLRGPCPDKMMKNSQHTFLYRCFGLKDGKIDYKHWEQCVDMEIERIDGWLFDVRAFLAKTRHVSQCSLPKKKQRALGLLPPVGGAQ